MSFWLMICISMSKRTTFCDTCMTWLFKLVYLSQDKDIYRTYKNNKWETKMKKKLKSTSSKSWWDVLTMIKTRNRCLILSLQNKNQRRWFKKLILSSNSIVTVFSYMWCDLGESVGSESDQWFQSCSSTWASPRVERFPKQ